MMRKINSLDEAPIDVVEAVKRGFIHRGFIPRKYQRNSQLIEAKATDPGANKAEYNSQNTQQATNINGGGADSEPGSQEASKDPEEQDPGEVHEKLIDITEKAHAVLYEAETVFPFTLFPDTITLDKEKLSVASRSFFRTAKIMTVPLTSLISAEASVGPFFGSVSMTSKYFVNSSHSVHFLWRKDATELHRLLQGFIIAQEKGFDVTEIEVEDLRALLHDLGQGVSD